MAPVHTENTILVRDPIDETFTRARQASLGSCCIARGDPNPFFSDVGNVERRWRMLISEARFRGKPFVIVWLPPISRCLFPDERRRQRTVIEPSAGYRKMIRDLIRCGDANLMESGIPSQTRYTGHVAA